jgi:hypothetical protein
LHIPALILFLGIRTSLGIAVARVVLYSAIAPFGFFPKDLHD